MPQILHLWLDYDFYLLNSETPPFSRQTVVAEQIKAPSVYQKKKLYFNYFKILSFYPSLEKFITNSLFKWDLVLVFNNIKDTPIQHQGIFFAIFNPKK